MFTLNPLGSYDLFLSNFSNVTNSTCIEPLQYLWVYQIFHECIHNTKEEVGFILGLISILCWIIASLPQLYENYKKGKADESISFWFLLCWLLGDSCNLIGCILTQQFPIQLYTAIYYVSMDIVMILQFLYYKLKHHKQTRGRGIINDALSSPKRNHNVLCCLCLGVFFRLTFLHFGGKTEIVQNNPSRFGRTLLQLEMPTPSHVTSWTPERTVGYVIGCFSSLFYLGSRLPQILKNYHRGQTDGLAPAMFVLAITGNTLYGASILLQDPAPGSTWGIFILYHLPWLIGSIGTLSLDIFILSQIIYYDHGCCGCVKDRPLILVVNDDAESYSDEPLIV